MGVDALDAHLRTLITLDETEAPLVSCYVNRDIGWQGDRTLFEWRVETIRRVLRRREIGPFEDALDRIGSFLTKEARLTMRGVAAFARAGTKPFFLGLEFQVPLPDRLSVASSPDVFHLVELRDTYHRYIVLLVTETSARILEVSLGAMTREIWTEQPQLRGRIGAGWTRRHYQDHRNQRSDQFSEEFAILEKLMAAGAHTHLIIAGSSTITARVQSRLPKRLLDKLIDVVPASSDASTGDVVVATLSRFIERERQESLDAVAAIVRAVRRGGLAAVGSMATLAALQQGEADVLVMARAYTPEAGWRCKGCEWVGMTSSASPRCPACESRQLQSANIKELMIKLAEEQSVEVELVEDSDALMDLGGVGCLLRYGSRSALALEG